MKERPILFSGHMVRAILEGRKTQTRRIVDPKFDWDLMAFKCQDMETGEFEFIADTACGIFSAGIRCPYGSVGDHLWVRETWCPHGEYDSVKPSEITGCSKVYYRADKELDVSKWRPSIFMPRWASRITLEITGVRVERLQDITDNDAQAEGIFFTDYGKICFHPKPCPLPNNHEHHQQKNGWSHCESNSDDECIGSPRFAFARLWNSINDNCAQWDSNPWVWVIEFRRIDK